MPFTQHSSADDDGAVAIPAVAAASMYSVPLSEYVRSNGKFSRSDNFASDGGRQAREDSANAPER